MSEASSLSIRSNRKISKFEGSVRVLLFMAARCFTCSRSAFGLDDVDHGLVLSLESKSGPLATMVSPALSDA